MIGLKAKYTAVAEELKSCKTGISYTSVSATMKFNYD